MNFKPLQLTSALLVTGALSFGLVACGSGDDDAGDSSATTGTPAAVTGTTGQQEPAKKDGATGGGKSGGKGNGKKVVPPVQPEAAKPGNVRPNKKAPDSAGDRKPNAPDKGISKREKGVPSPS